METILIIFIGITAAFFLLLILKAITSDSLKRLCAICGAVSITWLILLFLFWTGRFSNIAIIALLMGESIVGIYYAAESYANKNNKALAVFRLPFILALTFIAVLVLGIVSHNALLTSALFIILLWLAF